MGDLKARIAKRAAQEFHDGDVVNLGIGLPTMCTSYLPEGVDICLQSENGFTGLSGKAEPGKEDYRVIDSGSGFSHLALKLETGRTHQIRVHMAYLGHPVAGDPVYGPSKVITELHGQCLHAKKIGFVHPITGEFLSFDSELPEYFRRFLSKNEIL